MNDLRFDAEGFFFSALDQARYQRLFETLVHRGKSVAMLCGLGTLVEHYGGRLLQDLRTRSDVILETYTASGADALLVRMNRLLEPLSLEEARGQGERQGALHVFVLHELDGFEEDEAALLARFAQDLPGARVALLFLGYRRKRLPEVLETSFRQSLHTWSISEPDDADLEALREAAEPLGMAEEVAPRLAQVKRERLLALLADGPEAIAAQPLPSPPEPAEKEPGHGDEPALDAVGAPGAGECSPAGPTETASEAPSALSPLRSWPWLLGGAGLLFLLALALLREERSEPPSPTPAEDSAAPASEAELPADLSSSSPELPISSR